MSRNLEDEDLTHPALEADPGPVGRRHALPERLRLPPAAAFERGRRLQGGGGLHPHLTNLQRHGRLCAELVGAEGVLRAERGIECRRQQGVTGG